MKKLYSKFEVYSLFLVASVASCIRTCLTFMSRSLSGQSSSLLSVSMRIVLLAVYSLVLTSIRFRVKVVNRTARGSCGLQLLTVSG